ncbi:unnamed protein product [Brassica oleracea var. botrytis]
MATQKQIQTSSVSNEKVTVQDLRPRHTTKLLLRDYIIAERSNIHLHVRICQQITRLGLFLLHIEENKLRMSKRWYTLIFRDSDILFTKSESYIIDFQHRQQFLFISSFVD